MGLLSIMTSRRRRIFTMVGLTMVIVAAMELFYAQYGYSEVVDRIVAVVNDDLILDSELEEAMAPMRHKLSSEGFSEAQQRIYLADQRPAMLEQLINEKLTDQQIKKNQIHISDEELNATIERIKTANKLTDESLSHRLEIDGLTLETYRAKIKEQILRQKLVNLEVKSKIVITDRDIQDYYKKNIERYAGKQKYHLRHILLKVDPAASAAERQRIYQLMQYIYNRLQAGESFSQLAGVYSEATSASQGGDLGVFEVGLLAKPIKDALEGLAKGQFSKIVETDPGYQIFYVEDILQTGGKTIEEAKSEIEDKLYAEIVNQKFQSWLKELRENAHIQILN
jgi:peptidyl-prolyl cis-trans isomerase SurA